MLLLPLLPLLLLLSPLGALAQTTVPPPIRDCSTLGHLMQCKLLPNPADNSPQEVVSGLWIGNVYGGRNASFLAEQGITGVVLVSLANETRLSGLEYLDLDITGGSTYDTMLSQFEQGHQFINEILARNESVAVVSNNGVSQCAAVVAAHLIASEPGETVLGAIGTIRLARPFAVPAFQFRLGLLWWFELWNLYSAAE
jgi:hypothetical protein